MSVRITVLVAMVSMLASCMAWQQQNEPISRVIAEHRPDEIRVRLASGFVTVLNPVIRNDTLTGRSAGRRVAIPVANVRSVSVRRLHAGKTVGLIAGLGLTAAVIAAAGADDLPAPVTRTSGGGGGGGTELYSCPLVYSWDGSVWRLDSGTFGGSITRAATRTDVDNLVYAVPQDGTLRLRLVNELSETDYVDALTVLAVDHEPGFSVAPDAFGRLFTVGELQEPLAAHDFHGRDVLDRIAYADGWNWESSLRVRDTGDLDDIRDGLEVTFRRPPGATEARLVLDGNNTLWSSYLMGRFVSAHGSATQAWYDSLDSDTEKMRELGNTFIREAFLSVSSQEGDRWVQQGFFWEAGPEVVKRQVLVLDLSSISGNTVTVRLESAPAFWLIDHLAVDYSPIGPVSVQELQPSLALDLAGRDVRSLLSAANEDYVVLETGDRVELEFQIPPVPQGRARSYMLQSTGWYRIHSDTSGEPDRELLHAVTSEEGGMSRAAVALLNEALQRMELGAS